MKSKAVLAKEEARRLIGDRAGPERVPKKFKVITDTSDFCRIDYNDVVVLDNTPFWVKRYEKEGRFGLDDEPKYWVRRAIDLLSGETRILKLVFHEKFTSCIGGVRIESYRSPKKEARILDLVKDHRNFMHGRWVLDTAGNNVRILEFIHGRRFDDIINALAGDHETYFHQEFPAILDQYIELAEAIRFLHRHGEKHGDIRRDHIIFDKELNCNRWIDFDYNYRHGESMFSFDLHGLGNILIYLVGREDILVADLHREQREIFDRLWGEDLNISYKNRVANLRKIYPYIPESLNLILLHFSFGAKIFYDTIDQMLADLGTARADLHKLTGK
jgi:hypothetical protein